jgi:hypothetical protein
VQQFDLRESNRPTRNRKRALRTVGKTAGVVAVATSLVFLVIWTARSAWLTPNLFLVLLGTLTVSVGASAFGLMVRLGPIPESITLTGGGLRLDLEDEPPRSVDWLDPRFGMEFFAGPIKGRFQYVMLGRSWKMFVMLSRDAYDAILREATARGLQVQSEPLRSSGSLHVLVSRTAVGGT